MIAKLHMQKVVINGERHRKLLGFSGVKTWADVPKGYLNGFPHFYTYLVLQDLLTVVSPTKHMDIAIGEAITEDDYQELLRIMKGSGKRLTKIYLDAWKGDEIVEI